jgi:hypothetical protein
VEHLDELCDVQCHHEVAGQGEAPADAGDWVAHGGDDRLLDIGDCEHHAVRPLQSCRSEVVCNKFLSSPNALHSAEMYT